MSINTIIPAVEAGRAGQAGLSEDETTAAKLRWSIFEEWVKAKPEYEGWAADPDLFKKAQEEFKNSVGAHTKVVVVK